MPTEADEDEEGEGEGEGGELLLWWDEVVDWLVGTMPLAPYKIRIGWDFRLLAKGDSHEADRFARLLPHQDKEPHFWPAAKAAWLTPKDQ